ncbi:unnamed protein product [Ixodes pacificus]
MTRCNVSHPGNRCKERPQTLSGGKKMMLHQKGNALPPRYNGQHRTMGGKWRKEKRVVSSGQQKARQWGLGRPARGGVRPRDPFRTPARTQKRWPPLQSPTRRERQAGLSVVPPPARASYL